MKFMTYKEYRAQIIANNQEEIDTCDCCGETSDCKDCDGYGNVDCEDCDDKFKFSEKFYYMQKKSDFANISGKCESCEWNSEVKYLCRTCPDNDGSNYKELK